MAVAVKMGDADARARNAGDLPDPLRRAFNNPWAFEAELRRRTASSRSATVKLVWLNPTIIFRPSDHGYPPSTGSVTPFTNPLPAKPKTTGPATSAALEALHGTVPVQPVVRAAVVLATHRRVHVAGAIAVTRMEKEQAHGTLLASASGSALRCNVTDMGEAAGEGDDREMLMMVPCVADNAGRKAAR
jgi:hypothetical protein